MKKFDRNLSFSGDDVIARDLFNGSPVPSPAVLSSPEFVEAEFGLGCYSSTDLHRHSETPVYLVGLSTQQNMSSELSIFFSTQDPMESTLLVAQNQQSMTDAGGGLVQQDDDSGYGALGWGDAGLGLLALGALAAAAGGGGSTTTVDVPGAEGVIGVSGLAYTLKLTGDTYSVSTIGGRTTGQAISYIDASNLGTSNLDLPDLAITLNTDADRDAPPGEFEIFRGVYSGGTFQIVSSDAALGSVDANDIIIVWDSGKWGGRDVGIVVQNFNSNTTLKIENVVYSVTANSSDITAITLSSTSVLSA